MIDQILVGRDSKEHEQVQNQNSVMCRKEQTNDQRASVFKLIEYNRDGNENFEITFSH